MKRNDIDKVLIIGSGPIVIGQACEFDYSGTQACKALKALGYKVVLVNSNPATIMTDPVMADATYIEPLNEARLEQIIEKERPDAQSELDYRNPFELLVAVILSAQCTDKRVNMVTPSLFEVYPTAESLAKATPDEVYELIKSISYPRNKSKHLVGMAQRLVSDFQGIVPDNTEDLQKLPGVGRKTANVITAVIFDKPTFAVDTHVFRVANRIGLTNDSKTPLETELELTKHFPAEKIPLAHHWILLHGRYVCTARNPKCSECEISKVCKFFLKKEKSE